MEELLFKFGTPAPVVFRERGCDTDFAARVTGGAAVSDCDAARYGEGEAAEAALKKLIAELIPDCLARWPEGKRVMGSGNGAILGGLLETALSAAGVTAKITVRSIDLVPESTETYRQIFGEEMLNRVFPPIQTDGLEDEPHGPLIGFGYDRFSHGMMMGSSSSSGDELRWNRDGSITLICSVSAGGKSVRTEYRVKPEAAQKVRDYVAEKRLAALSKEKIPTPAMTDNFTSSSIHMTFDDRALGGGPFERCSIQYGPAGMTFRTIEDEISELLKECRETGEYASREESGAGEVFGDFLGMAKAPGMADFLGAQQDAIWMCPKCGRPGNMGAFCTGCASPRPAAPAGTAPAAPAKPEAASAEAQPGCWTCTNCGYNGNKGKFCVECGCPR